MPRDWKRFWADQNDPRHPRTANFFVDHGKELALVVGDPAGQRVLEFGCGSGSLFGEIGFDRAKSYRGVDFSEKMLAAFRVAHPGVETVCADASDYVDGAQYDLIFSNAVAQYFDPQMLRRHVAHASAMLAPGGRLIIGSIPWRGARTSFHLQTCFPTVERGLVKGLLVLARAYAGVDQIGYWYSYRDITRLARRFGLTPTYFGCVQYPYRIHARLDRIA